MIWVAPFSKGKEYAFYYEIGLQRLMDVVACCAITQLTEGMAATSGEDKNNLEYTAVTREGEADEVCEVEKRRNRGNVPTSWMDDFGLYS